MTTRDLTAAYFQQTISANSNVLVYFWAPLCAPCDLFTPTYEASSRKHFDVVHGKVNHRNRERSGLDRRGQVVAHADGLQERQAGLQTSRHRQSRDHGQSGATTPGIHLQVPGRRRYRPWNKDFILRR
ncbi:putative thioredoxin TRXA [Mycobacterium tuberculosis RGTB423]|nr:putative thioredoxin TRXA [Mycobacterium tuberculosis RGTB423]